MINDHDDGDADNHDDGDVNNHGDGDANNLDDHNDGIDDLAPIVAVFASLLSTNMTDAHLLAFEVEIVDYYDNH